MGLSQVACLVMHSCYFCSAARRTDGGLKKAALLVETTRDIQRVLHRGNLCGQWKKEQENVPLNVVSVQSGEILNSKMCVEESDCFKWRELFELLILGVLSSSACRQHLSNALPAGAASQSLVLLTETCGTCFPRNIYAHIYIQVFVYKYFYMQIHA